MLRGRLSGPPDDHEERAGDLARSPRPCNVNRAAHVTGVERRKLPYPHRARSGWVALHAICALHGICARAKGEAGE